MHEYFECVLKTFSHIVFIGGVPARWGENSQTRNKKLMRGFGSTLSALDNCAEFVELSQVTV